MSVIIPVIMAGGSGTRLWPMSRAHMPKQFLSLTSQFSMLQETLNRLENIEHAPPIIICNEEHRFLVAEQLRDLGLSHSGIILEPVGRNTAPAISLAATHALALYENEDPILLVLAADHLIKDINVFCQAVKEAEQLAIQNLLVTFGIVATKPETGYGYIKCGKQIESLNSSYIVDSFVEKPDLDTAQLYIDSGQYLWNSGMFMFKANRYIKELALFQPDIVSTTASALNNSIPDLDFIRLSKDDFEQCPNVSVDYAVMEHTQDAVVVPLDAGWNDIGSWSSLWEISNKDDAQNVLKGDVLVENSYNCYVKSPNKLISIIGVSDLIIVDTKDALLVAHREHVQDVKNIVDKLKNNHRKEYQQHREIYRPWGKYDHIAEGTRYHVKKITVKPGEKTATQLHYHRAEHWIVVSGTAKVYNGNNEQIISENESIFIPLGTPHYFENPGKIPLEIIEVRTGCYLEEDDIIRI
ncbi:mannose-1-phosphate guanylyltransferase/mannose-6-phosphate isomerase [Providencia stuartii]|uniref:mannose-1-phosphate guanylyltransferase n=1 Tax=Providencia stuartii ATCC 25827 TaxID=471874 RepID=A0AA87CWA6_PROST|nr:mannose-1-phosphate guanylyltransferase/mannose-6-phosphate isomerase [Providencia stuartii]EDU61608.1 mannose-1-phosphate guanylyltransferase/mannose-6-phosphate isomerase [Providencia stuartii ATCC 25827]